MTQMQILPGDLHWIVQMVHLGFGLVALGLAATAAGSTSMWKWLEE